jgi:gamma-glutamyltranspeptidase/glutathione hydrolase
MVSTAHPLATEVGLDILKAGGNAFDAAVAVAAALNVVEPMMSGIGGYGTILVWHAESSRVRFLNPSGRIPAGVDSDAFRPPTPDYLENRRGAKAVSTPGNVNAWEAMSTEYGLLGWATLFEPAIGLAEEGFEIDERTAGMISRAFDAFPEHARVFYGTNGRPLASGERLVQKDLARSMRLIAAEGARAVYGGKLGSAIDLSMREEGGFLTLADLEANEAEWWPHLALEYRGYQVVTAAPPANAFPDLVRLGIMSRFDLWDLGHNTVEYLHRYAEATKHAYWTRLRYAMDPDVRTPILSHFVVADRWGNVVSATQTLGNAFGSRIMPEGTGIWLNNSLAYSTFEPKGNPMDAHPGRRKLSGDVPVIVFRRGRPWIALGTPGGHTIGQTVPQMLMNMIDFEMDIQEAISAGRISFIEPDVIAVERGVLEEVHRAMEARGHNVRAVDGLGNAHGLTIEYNRRGEPVRFTGGADPRGTGMAKGY